MRNKIVQMIHGLTVVSQYDDAKVYIANNQIHIGSSKLLKSKFDVLRLEALGWEKIHNATWKLPL